MGRLVTRNVIQAGLDEKLAILITVKNPDLGAMIFAKVAKHKSIYVPQINDE